jgi:bifunctional DNA-binding transcriptional regulator/antitoxin component of YhaV-PrlF toxin-antitoxin module
VALLLETELLEAAGIQPDDEVEVAASAEGIVVKRRGSSRKTTDRYPGLYDPRKS